MKNLIIIAFLFLASCGGGGGGSDDTNLSTDACNVIGLPSKSFRIVNGTACGNLSSSPVVRVVLYDSSGQALGYCSATVISSTKVLTAGHCALSGTNFAQVVYGDISNQKKVNVTRIVVEPNFSIGKSGGASFSTVNDVAIFTVNQSLPLTPQPILGSKSIDEGEIISIFGYGIDQTGTPSLPVLRSGEMLVDKVDLDHISAVFSGDGSDTCSGDSGGPAIVAIGNRFAIAGTLSFGTIEKCTEGDESVFMNLSKPELVNFIRSEAPNAEIL